MLIAKSVALGIVAMMALLAVDCQNQTAAPSRPSYATRESTFLKSLVVAGEFSGAVLVAKDGKIQLRAGFGMADRSLKVANSTGTKFRIGSITKTFTATAIVMLEHQSKLALGDSICTYVLPCPDAWQPVTLKQLLTHSSGIPDYIAPMTLAQFVRPTPPADLVALVRDQPLAFTPGTSTLYSNTGYLLLGMVIEKVSGQAYEAFLKTRIFAPLGMTATGLQRDFTAVPGHAVGYSDLHAFDLAPDGEAAWSDGGLYSTVDDLYSWDQGLLGTKLLPQSALDELFTVVNPPNQALGWLVIKDQFGHRSIEHSGAIPGFSAILKRLVDQRSSVVVLANESGSVVNLALVLANAAIAG